MGTGIAIGVATVLFVGIVLWARSAKEQRAREWLAEARRTLPGLGELKAREDVKGFAAEGEVEGLGPVRLVIDDTVTRAALEVGLPSGVGDGAVFDMIVRDWGSQYETGRETVVAGFDVETKRLVLKSGTGPDAARAVGALRDEARSLREKLPQLLAEHAKEKSARAGSPFGKATGPDGRHGSLGIGFALAPEAWELVPTRPELLEWESLPTEESDAPRELRLYGVPQDSALGSEDGQRRLVERIAASWVERLPDGALPPGDVTPKPRPAAKVDLVEPVWEVDLDFEREVAVAEEKTEPRPYRTLGRVIFAPWVVVVVELTAPRGEAARVLDAILATAKLAEPAKRC